MIKPSILKKLKAECRRLGGQIATLSTTTQFYAQFKNAYANKAGTGLSEAPFTSWHGINYKDKILYVVKGHEETNSIIHEMGHIFASKKHPQVASDEFKWFGWEICLARRVGGFDDWSKNNYTYMIDYRDPVTNMRFADWGDLQRKSVWEDRERFIAERIKLSISFGNLTKNHIPRTVR